MNFNRLIRHPETLPGCEGLPPVQVYLPEGYLARGDRVYPVVYLLGDLLLDGEDEPLEGLLDRLGQIGWTPEVLLVKVPTGGHGQLERLKRCIDRRHPTLHGPQHTVLLGQGNAARTALSLAQRLPQVFGKVALFSPSGLPPRFPGHHPCKMHLDVLAGDDARLRPWRDWVLQGLHEGLEQGKDLLFLEVPGSRGSGQPPVQRLHTALVFLLGRLGAPREVLLYGTRQLFPDEPGHLNAVVHDSKGCTYTELQGCYTVEPFQALHITPDGGVLARKCGVMHVSLHLDGLPEAMHRVRVCKRRPALPALSSTCVQPDDLLVQ